MERWVAAVANAGWSDWGGLWRAAWASWPTWELLAACAVIGALGWLLRLLERGPRGRRGFRPDAPPPPPATPPEEEHPRCPESFGRGTITMDSILSRLKQLTCDELRVEIVNAGQKCGPITLTTRSIFEKRLAQSLLEQQGVSNAAIPVLNGAPGMAPNDGSLPGIKKTNSHLNSAEDGEFGYSVGLNPPEEEALMHKTSGSPVSSQTPSREPPLYYGVCTVYDDILARNERVHVYEDKKEALQAVKMIKGSRFKAFSNKEDAEKFAKGICDYFPSPNKPPLSLSPVKVCSAFSRDGLCSPEMEMVSKERANSYKNPRTQDLTAKLRKAVEKGDEATFLELIWSNPRYLIGSGDNPTIVQEGCRYNVMHVVAKENQAGICRLLLDTLENPEFMRLMYPDDDLIMLQKRIRFIVDFYLNTPDKMGFDTPLHFACKFGNSEIVKVLASHPGILKNRKNKYDQTPADVICERSKNKSADLKMKIREYLEGQYYVPLFRAEGNASAPVIGPPWSPDQADGSPLAPLTRYIGSPKDPVLTVTAYAGPMSPSKAEDFHKLWKTPPRDKAEFFHNFRKSDLERGVERVGRELAHELGFPWVEYWEFLGCFVDLSSQEGLQKLEEFLSQQEMSNKAQQETGENESHNRYKSPPSSGKSKKSCNSVSIGAFLDDEDISLEEVKNRQNAAKNYSSVISPAKLTPENPGGSKCDILSFEHPSTIIPRTKVFTRASEKEGPASKNGFYSPMASGHWTRSHQRGPPGQEDCFQSPVANLMEKFDQLSCQELMEADDASLGKLRQRAAKSQREDTSPGSVGLPTASSLLPKEMAASENEALKSREAQSPEADGQSAKMDAGVHSRHFETPGQSCLKITTSNGEAKQLFLLGDHQTKWDNDVLTALDGVEIDAQKYPAIYKWKKSVQAYPSSERQRWPSLTLNGTDKDQATSNTSLNPPYVSPGNSSPGRYNAAAASFSPDFGSPGRYTPAYMSCIFWSKRHFPGPPNP